MAKRTGANDMEPPMKRQCTKDLGVKAKQFRDVSGYAAEKGNLGMLQWLHENNIPMHPQLALATLRSKNVEVFAWVMKEYPYSHLTCFDMAIDFDCVDVMKWLTERYKFETSFIEEFVPWCLINGKLNSLKFFQTLGIDVSPEKHLEKEENIDKDVRKWLIEIGIKVPEKEIELNQTYFLKVLKHEEIDSVKKLMEAKCPFDPEKVVEFALENVSPKFLFWMKSEGGFPFPKTIDT